MLYSRIRDLAEMAYHTSSSMQAAAAERQLGSLGSRYIILYSCRLKYSLLDLARKIRTCAVFKHF